MIVKQDESSILLRYQQHCFRTYSPTLIKQWESLVLSKGIGLASTSCLIDSDQGSINQSKTSKCFSLRRPSADANKRADPQEELESGMPLLELLSGGTRFSQATGSRLTPHAAPIPLFQRQYFDTIGNKEVRVECEQLIVLTACSSVYCGRLYTVPFDENAPANGNNFNFRVAIKNSLFYRKAANVPVIRDFRSQHHSPWALEYLGGYVDNSFANPVRNVFTSVFEYSRYGSLMHLLKAKEQFTEEQVRCVIEDILKCFQFLHEEVGVCHNDIKPHNILIFDAHDGPFNYYTPDDTEADMRGQLNLNFDRDDYKFKMADFEAVDRNNPIEKAWGRSPRFDNFFGTCLYVSPEYCLGISDSCTNDVWSLGIMAFQLLTGRVPWTPAESMSSQMVVSSFRSKYENIDNLMRSGRDGKVLTNSDNRILSSNSKSASVSDAFANFGPDLSELDLPMYSDEVRDFIRGCLVQNPLLRLRSSELREHPFMKGKKLSS